MKRWLWLLLLIPVLLLALAFGPPLVRRVPPYQAPSQPPSGWGSLEASSAGRLQAVLDGEVNRLAVPGLQAALRTRDGRTWSGASGTVDLERHRPMGRADILRVGSITKVFTATVILQLVEEGRLGLDVPLSRWFPNLPGASQITIRHLLGHRSGLVELLEIPSFTVRSALPWQRWSSQELVRLASQRQPRFPAGSSFRYSNTNFVLLGVIAERVTGRSAAQLFRERILGPLGLSATFFVPDEPSPARLVRGFDRDLMPLPGIWEIAPGNTGWPSAAFTSGAMVSNADDLVTFFEALFAGRLLSSASLREMTAFLAASEPNIPALTGYGLGLMRFSLGGEVWWGHTGQFIGFMAVVAHTPERGVTLAVIGNLSAFNPVSVLTDLSVALATPTIQGAFR